MSLSRKVALIVVLAFLLSALLSYSIQKIFIMPSFIKLEKQIAIQNSVRVIGAIDRELAPITTLVTDWSHWTDSYNYVKGENSNYEASNLLFDNTLSALNMNFVGFYNNTGKTIWSRAEESGTKEVVDIGQLIKEKLPADHPLIQHQDLHSDIRGIVSTLHGAMMVVSGPILTSEEEGPIAGTLMMGQFLDSSLIEQISKITQLSVEVDAGVQELDHSVKGEVSATPHGLLHTEYRIVDSGTQWQVFTTILDIFNKPIITLQINTPRSISAQGAKAVNQSLWVLAIIGLLVMLAFWKLLHQAVLKPISLLTEHALLIGKDDKVYDHIDLQRDDETGILANSFNQMIDRLAVTRRRLIDQSYHAGIAETASGVLHNIGNAITPLNVRLSQLREGLRTAPLSEMERAAAELKDPTTPPERRVDLVQFVELAGTEMAKLLRSSTEEVDLSIQQLAQVQAILTDQERFSRSARVIEPVHLVNVIKDMVAGLSPELKDVLNIDISSSVAEHGVVAGSSAALQQVVTNLLINAAESIKLAGIEDGFVIITAEQVEDYQGQSMVGLRFTDNGSGFDPKQLGRLFEKGFSTKNREGSGYGLHWTANTIQALGGKIFAENNEIDSGTTTLLVLPHARNLTEHSTDVNKENDGR